MSDPERIPGRRFDISNLKYSVALDGTVILEEATLPDWFSPEQRNEAKAELMREVTEMVAPVLKANGVDARFIWRSELESK